MSTKLNRVPIGGLTCVAYDGGPRGPCVQIDTGAGMAQLSWEETAAVVAVLKKWLTEHMPDGGGSR